MKTETIAPLLALLVACVPITRYEEAESAAAVEAEARRRAALELERSRQRLTELEAALQAREAELEARQRTLDERQLASTISEKERDENASMVDQLRTELSRTGEHLRSYSEEKARLERELQAAQEAQRDSELQAVAPAAPVDGPVDGSAPPLEADAAPPAAADVAAPPVSDTSASAAPAAAQPAADLGGLAHAVSAALAAVALDRKVKVTTKPDAVELVIGAESLFEEDSAALRAPMGALFAAAARLSSVDATLSGGLREADHDTRLSSALGEERRAQLAATLRQHGLDARIRLEPLDEPVSGAPRRYVLSLRSTGPSAKAGG